MTQFKVNCQTVIERIKHKSVWKVSTRLLFQISLLLCAFDSNNTISAPFICVDHQPLELNGRVYPEKEKKIEGGEEQKENNYRKTRKKSWKRNKVKEINTYLS